MFYSFRYCVVLVSILAAGTAIAADSKKAVREGVKAFRSGDFSKAAESFAEAERERPDDFRVAFNHGAALTASGKFDEAIESLRKSALSPDVEIASKSLDLLGRIAVARAKSLLPPESESTRESTPESTPEPIPPEQRQAILDRLQIAERYYMEAKEVDPSLETAGPALEQIRAWRDRVESEWNDADRRRNRRQEMTERLRWLEDWGRKQSDLVDRTVEEPDSPKKFQTFYETSKEQRDFSDEIVALRDDLRRQIAEETENDDNPESNWIVHELERLQGTVNNVGEALQRFQGEKASQALKDTVDRLGRLRINLSPFEVIVREAEKKQTLLCELNPAAPVAPSDAPPDAPPSSTDHALRHNHEEQSREEQRVADWMPLMLFRAREGLQEGTNATPAPPAEQAATVENAGPNEARKKSMELAVQHGPEIQKRAEQAAGALLEEAPEKALPDQQRALELLREILKALQDQQENNRQENNQQESEQQKSDQPKNERPEGQKQQDRQQRQNPADGKTDGKEEEPEKQERPEDRDENASEENERSPAPSKPNAMEKEKSPREKQEELEQAERMFRQVKRRQQEMNERRERIRALLRQTEPVEKDW